MISGDEALEMDRLLTASMCDLATGLSAWEVGFVESIDRRVRRGGALTTRQVETCQKILERYPSTRARLPNRAFAERETAQQIPDRWPYWWAEFAPGSAIACGTVYAVGRDAAFAEATKAVGEAPRNLRPLPYPAKPYLVKNGAPDACPELCHSPAECAGKTACPQRHSYCE